MTNWVELAAVVASPIAALGGYVLAGFNDEKRDTRTLERERVARKEVDDLSRIEKVRDFRMDVLLSLQDALQGYAIAMGKVNSFDHKQLREQGTLTKYPSELDEGARDALINLRRLKERVTDDETRLNINELITMASAVIVQSVNTTWTAKRIMAEIDASSLRFAQLYDEINDRVGVLIRTEITPPSLASK